MCHIRYSLEIKLDARCKQFICEVHAPPVYPITVRIWHRPSPDQGWGSGHTPGWSVVPHLNNNGNSRRAATCWISSGDYFCQIIQEDTGAFDVCFPSNCFNEKESCTKCGCVDPISDSGDSVCDRIEVNRL